MKKLAFALLVLVSSCTAHPAFAQCASVDAIREKIATHPEVSATWLEGEALRSAGELYNSLPPESANVIGTAVVVDLPDESGILGVGPIGAICDQVRFPVDRWQAVRRILLGVKT